MFRASAAVSALLLIIGVRTGAAQGPRQVTCESQGDRYAECAIPDNSQVRLVRTLSSSPCIAGRSYGAERQRIWVTTGCRGLFEVTPPTSPSGKPTSSGQSYLLRCESTRNATSECPVDPSATVRLVTQRSGTTCIEGQNWGRLGGSLYVSRGCRAEFEVTPTTRPGAFQRPVNTKYWVTCESWNERRFYCRVGDGDVPRLVQQRSTSACIEGTSWGIANGYLWVDDGCRASFEVAKAR
jgi:hypothetical protein